MHGAVAHSDTVKTGAVNWTMPPSSSSLMVTVAVLGEPRVMPPVGDESTTLNVRSPSSRVLGMTFTLNCAKNSPARKVSVPLAAV